MNLIPIEGREKEFVYILPAGNGGVMNVVVNLLRYSAHSEIKKKVILYGFEEKIRGKKFDIPCDNIIIIKYGRFTPKSHICKKITSHISPHSIIISNDGAHEIDALKLSTYSNPIIYIVHGAMQFYFNVLRVHKLDISSIISVSSYINKSVEDLGITNTQFVPFPVPTGLNYNIIPKETKMLRIVYVGILNNHKGTQFFEDFVKGLMKRKVSFTFDIVGTGVNELSLKNNLGKYKNVHFLGQKPNSEVIEIFKTSDICILFSKSEGLPISLVEAMKTGCIPVVFHTDSGIPDIIINRETGFIVQYGDVQNACDVVKELSIDKLLRKEVASNAQQFALSHFDPIIQTSKYENIFLEAKQIDRIKPSLKKRISYNVPSPILYFITNLYKNLFVIKKKK